MAERSGRDALLVGCGALGAAVGLRLAADGRRVVGLRRRGDLVPPPLEGRSVDLTREEPRLPALDLGVLVVALTARPRTEEAYRATYVDGLRRALDALDRAGVAPSRAVLVSSTAVYGESPADLVDEDTPAAPADGPGRMLLAAEELFSARVPGGTVLRLSGLYGVLPSRFVDRVRAGEPGALDRWTNRIHRSDAAAAVVHLLTRPDPPGPIYVGTDDEPAPGWDVAAWVAELLGVAPPARPGEGRPPARGRRLSNARLRAAGFAPAYPTYREGYRALLG